MKSLTDFFSHTHVLLWQDNFHSLLSILFVLKNIVLSSFTCLMCYSYVPVTHYSMWLLVSWAHCCSTVKSSLADSDHLHDWLKKLTLLVPEVRSGGEYHETMNNCYLALSSSCFSSPYLKTWPQFCFSVTFVGVSIRKYCLWEESSYPVICWSYFDATEILTILWPNRSVWPW